MLPGPVFNVELITTARRARYYAIRFAYGMLLLFFLWQNNPSQYSRYYGQPDRGMTIQELAEFGQQVFLTFLSVQSAAVLLLTPSLVAGVIAEEKQRKTLHYLLSSCLTSGEIVFGKLAARLLHVGIIVAIGLPVMSLLSLVGGIDPQSVLLSFAATITTALFLASLSILVSTLSRKPREAIGLVYCLEFTWLFIPPSLGFLMTTSGQPFWVGFYEYIRPVNEWIAPSSPFALVPGLGRSNPWGFLGALCWMMGLQLVYSVAFVLVAILRLRPGFRKEGEQGRWHLAASRARRFLPRPPCGDDAMLWKERHVSRTNALTKIVTGVIGVLLLGLLVYGLYEWSKPAFHELSLYGYGWTGTTRARDDLNGFLRIVTSLIYVAWALAIASAASSTVTQEREADTWISLVATPLAGREIVRAKLIGAVWGLRGLGLLLVGLWMFGVAAGAVHPFALGVVVIEAAIFLWFVAALGVCISVRARNSARAMTATIAILIALNGGYLMCCIPMHPDTPFIVTGITPFILPASLFSYEEFGNVINGSNRFAEMVAVCVAGVLAYGTAAAMLTISTINSFDDWIDRPRRAWKEPFATGPDSEKPEADVVELD